MWSIDSRDGLRGNGYDVMFTLFAFVLAYYILGYLRRRREYQVSIHSSPVNDTYRVKCTWSTHSLMITS